MRVSCSACGAQYNLPNEKVRGRRVRVRCKRCPANIIADGRELVTPTDFDDDETTQVIKAPQIDRDVTTIWAVNLSDTDQREMTSQELSEGWRSGLVTDDAFLWKEGMGDWKPIGEVAEIVALISEPQRSGAIQASENAATRAPPKGSTRASAPATPSYETAAEGGSALATPAGRAPQAAHDSATSPHDFFGDPARRGPKPRQESTPAENSVLFSLDALKAAAADSEPPRPEKNRPDDLLISNAPSSHPRPLEPLIDVGAAVVNPTAAAASPVIPTPALIAVAPKQEGRRGAGWLIALLVLFGAVAVAYLGAPYLGIDLAAVAGLKEKPAQVTPAATTAALNPVVATATTAVAQPATTDTATIATLDSAPSPSIADETQAETAVPATPTSDTEVARPADRAAASPATRKPGAAQKPKLTLAADKPKRNEAKHNQALPQDQRSQDQEEQVKETEPKPQPSALPSEPETQEKTDKSEAQEKPDEEAPANPPFNTVAAKAALKQASGQVAACKTADGPVGKGKVQVTFVPSGRVTTALVVSGPFGGSSVGGCVARTFRRARIPAFSGPPVHVSRSFRIK